MSHFLGLCFGENWESDVELYNEYNDVDPYVVYYKEDAIKSAQLQHEDDYKRAIEMLKKDNLDPNSLALYTAIETKGPTLTEEQAWYAVQDWGYEIDEDGNLISRYNPDSRWDWFSVGGRWSGFLLLKAKDAAGEPIQTNEASVGEIDWEAMKQQRFTPFCYITTEGEWCEKGEMGWWGHTENEVDQHTWDDEFYDYLSTLDSDCLVTVVDFHI